MNNKKNYKGVVFKFCCCLLVVVSLFLISYTIKSYNEINSGYQNASVLNNIENKNVQLEKLNDKCKAYYLVEYESGKVLSSFNEDEKYQIASMVKIMSASIVFDKIKEKKLGLEESVEISERASQIEGSKVLLDKGSKHKVKDLLKSVIVCSANDSVLALAEKIAGTEENFVDLMNEKVTKLGLKNTKFVNATGLPLENQYSTARDVAIMLKDLMQNPLYFEYCKIWLEDYNHPSGRKTSMTNTNKLIKYYKGCDSGKTGYTSVAKHCLAASASRNNTRFISVCIGGNTSKERFYTVSELFNYGFTNYSNRVIVNKGQKVGEVKILGGNKKTVPILAKENISIFAKNNEKIKYDYEVVSLNVKAPIKKGQKVALLRLKTEGYVKDFELVAGENIEKQNYINSINDILTFW